VGKILEFKDAPQCIVPGQVGRENFSVVNQDSGATKMSLMLNEYEPNMVQKHYHYHEKKEQVIITLEGSGTYELNEIEHQLKPKTVVFLAAGDKHGIKSAGEEGLKVIEISSLPSSPSDHIPVQE
jgi:quercetin dioxygenase-like cupin family protein